MPFLLIFGCLVACNEIIPTQSGLTQISPSPTITIISPTLSTPVETLPPTTIPATPSVATFTPTIPTIIAPEINPEDWQNWPVIPTMTDKSLEIFMNGLALGNNPQSFSKMGDCETDTDWFLANFDKSEAYYNLGPYKDELSDVIDYFSGSFSRDSLAAQDGGSAATLLNPMWANPDLCRSGETPLECEIRVQKPAFALIAVGTNDTVRIERFEGNMRRVIDRLIELGVVPILSTKADNLEGDNAINLTIARLAIEYDLMMWNFWAAVQPLPNQGLLEDGAHLTWARNDFSNPTNLEKAWPVRNLTALQLFDMLRRSTMSISE